MKPATHTHTHTAQLCPSGGPMQMCVFLQVARTSLMEAPPIRQLLSMRSSCASSERLNTHVCIYAPAYGSAAPVVPQRDEWTSACRPSEQPRFPAVNQVRLLNDLNNQVITDQRSRCSPAPWRNSSCTWNLWTRGVGVRWCTSSTWSWLLIRPAASSPQPESLPARRKVQRC